MLLMMEQQLKGNDWFAGDTFSAVDIQMYVTVLAANASNGLDKSKHAKLLKWLKRCEARVAFRRAEKKGGRVNF